MYDKTILETVDYHGTMLGEKVNMLSYLPGILKAVESNDDLLGIGCCTRISDNFACLVPCMFK